MSKLTVDFILPETGPEATPPAEGLDQTCGCGSQQFVLVSEMKLDVDQGIPASRMYECLGCGTYRLG